MWKTKGRAAFFGILFGILMAAVYIAADFVSCASCAGTQDNGRISETRLLLGTTCSIVIGSEDVARLGEDAAYQLINEAFARCEEREALFSMNIEGSDVWQINHAGGVPVYVARNTIEVIEKGIAFGELSDGMFDITIGRLTELWGISFDTGEQTKPKVPPNYEIDACRDTVDYKQIGININTVQLENPDAALDLGGIAKGYIADWVAKWLAERGVENALVDFGGDIVVLGSRGEGSTWRLGVARPFGSEQDLVGILEVSDVAVVSSGIYERQVEIDGELYHHIIDPTTGFPAKSDVVGATIIASDAVTGEGLSTIAILVGSGRIQEICEKTPGFIGAVLVLDNGETVTFGEAELVVSS